MHTVNQEVSHLDLFSKSIKDAVQKWQISWNESDMERYFYLLNPKVNQEPWFYDVLFTRGSIVSINRLRLNHNCSRVHLNRIKIVSSPYCECGYDLDTVDHILFECQLTDSIHRSMFIHLIKNNFNIRLISTLNILKNGHPRVYTELAKYLTKGKFKI